MQRSRRSYYPVPLYLNPDNLHCYQKCLKMITGYFRPDIGITDRKLDRLTGFKGGTPSLLPGLAWLADSGLYVCYKTLLKAEDDGEIPDGISLSEEIPEISDVETCLAKKGLALCLVNGCVLRRKKGRVGHCVVVAGCNPEKKQICLNDPGAPSGFPLVIPYSLFKKTWAYPDADSRVLVEIYPVSPHRKRIVVHGAGPGEQTPGDVLVQIARASRAHS